MAIGPYEMEVDLDGEIKVWYWPPPVEGRMERIEVYPGDLESRRAFFTEAVDGLNHEAAVNRARRVRRG